MVEGEVLEDMVENVGALAENSGIAILFRGGVSTDEVMRCITDILNDWYRVQAETGGRVILRSMESPRKQPRGTYWRYFVKVELVPRTRRKYSMGIITVKKPITATSEQQLFYISFEFDGINPRLSELSQYHSTSLISYLREKLKLPAEVPVYNFDLPKPAYRSN